MSKKQWGHGYNQGVGEGLDIGLDRGEECGRFVMVDEFITVLDSLFSAEGKSPDFAILYRIYRDRYAAMLPRRED